MTEEEFWSMGSSTATLSEDDFWKMGQSAEAESPYAIALRNSEAAKAQGVDPFAANVQRAAEMQLENSPRGFLTSNIVSRTGETLMDSMGNKGASLIGSAYQGIGNALGLEGLAEMGDLARDIAQGNMPREEAKQAILDKRGVLNETVASWVRSAGSAVGESIPVGAIGGLPGMAGWFALTTYDRTLNETGSQSQALAHGAIEGAFSMVGGKLLGSGTGKLAQKLFGSEAGSTLGGKAAEYLMKKLPLPKWAAEAIGGSGGEVLEEALTEGSHYLADVALTDKEFDKNEMVKRMAAVIGPSALAGGMGGAVTSVVDVLNARYREMPVVGAAIEDAQKFATENPEKAKEVATLGPVSRRQFKRHTGKNETNETYRDAFVEELRRTNEELNRATDETAPPADVLAPRRDTPPLTDEQKSELKREINRLRKGGVLSQTHYDQLESLDPQLASDILSEAGERAQAENERRNELRAEYLSLVPKKTRDRVRGKERKGGDAADVFRFDQLVDALRGHDGASDFPNLAGEASSRGGGDLEAGLRNIVVTGGARNFDPVSAEKFIPDLLPETNETNQAEPAVGRSFTVDPNQAPGVGAIKIDQKAVEEVFPGATVKQTGPKSWRVTLANGRFADVVGVPNLHPIPSEKARIRKRYPHISDSDWATIQGAGLYEIVSRDGERLPIHSLLALSEFEGVGQDTLRHEAVHWARALGLFDDSEWQQFTERYAKGIKDDGSVEEAIARGLQSEGSKAIAARIRDFFRKLLKLIGLEGISSDARRVMMDPEFWNRPAGRGKSSTADTSLIPAYHGSPHKHNKFSTEFVGTGEGGAAYGWGLYFASQKEVAQYYKSRYSDVESDTSLRPDVRGVAERAVQLIQGKDLPFTIEDWIRRHVKGTFPPLKDDVADLAIQAIRDGKVKRGGALYTVDLKPTDEELLDWDKPLDQQSQGVKDRIRGNIAWGSHQSGEDIYRALELAYRTDGPYSKRRVSQYLHSLGIRGIKYKDQGSRGKEGGTYNYVIFDDADVSIEGTEYQLTSSDPNVRRKLANIALTPRERNWLDELDRVATEAGEPGVRHDQDVFNEAGERLANDREAERSKIMQIASRGGQLNDVETVIAKQLFQDEAFDALESGDAQKILEASRLRDAYRATGTEQGRAFRQRRDPLGGKTITEATPKDRLTLLTDEIFQRDKKQQKARDKALRNGDAAELEKLDRKWAQRLKNIERQLNALGLTLKDLPKIAEDAVTTSRVRNQISAANKDFWDKLFEYRQSMGLLSGAATQAANISGNLAHGVYDFVVQAPTEAAINQALDAMGRDDPAGRRLGELPHLWRGIRRGVAQGIQNAIVSWKTEMPVTIGSDKFDQPNVAIGGKLGRVVRAPGYRLLTAADEFFNSLFSNIEVGGAAFRTGVLQGLSGEELEAFIDSEVMDRDSLSWRLALKHAAELTFNQELQGTAAKALQAGMAIRRVRGMRWFIPFVSFPVKSATTALRKGPVTGDVAMLKAAYDNWQAGRPATFGMSRRFAERVIAWGTVAALAASLDDEEPWITGPSTAPPGAPKSSVKIGDQWFSYGRIEPFATILGGTVDGVMKLKGGSTEQVVTAPVEITVSQVGSKTFLQGTADFLSLIGQTQESKSQKPTERAARWAARFGESFVPNFYRQIGESSREGRDETKVWGTSTGEKVAMAGERLAEGAGVPLIDYTARIDVWGRPLPKGDAPFWSAPLTDFTWRLLSPVYTAPVEPTHGDKLLARWNAQNPDQQTTLDPPQAVVTLGSKQVALTSAEYEEYQKVAGEIANRLVSAMPDTDTPTERTIKSIKAKMALARKQARARLAPKWRARLNSAASPVPRSSAAPAR